MRLHDAPLTVSKMHVMVVQYPHCFVEFAPTGSLYFTWGFLRFVWSFKVCAQLSLSPCGRHSGSQGTVKTTFRLPWVSGLRKILGNRLLKHVITTPVTPVFRWAIPTRIPKRRGKNETAVRAALFDQNIVTRETNHPDANSAANKRTAQHAPLPRNSQVMK